MAAHDHPIGGRVHLGDRWETGLDTEVISHLTCGEWNVQIRTHQDRGTRQIDVPERR